jgi:hypothetical protein
MLGFGGGGGGAEGAHPALWFCPGLYRVAERPGADECRRSQALQSRKAKPLTLLPLVALIFYDVSGGPFGIEVRAGLAQQ